MKYFCSIHLQKYFPCLCVVTKKTDWCLRWSGSELGLTMVHTRMWNPALVTTQWQSVCVLRYDLWPGNGILTSTHSNTGTVSQANNLNQFHSWMTSANQRVKRTPNNHSRIEMASSAGHVKIIWANQMHKIICYLGLGKIFLLEAEQIFWNGFSLSKHEWEETKDSWSSSRRSCCTPQLRFLSQSFIWKQRRKLFLKECKPASHTSLPIKNFIYFLRP